MDINKYDISEKRYLNHVRKKIASLPNDGKMVVVMLCRKLKTFSSYCKGAPVFLIEPDNRESVRLKILTWAEELVKEPCKVPDVRLLYLVARFSEKEYDLFIEGHIDDEDLMSVRQKYWAEREFDFDNSFRE